MREIKFRYYDKKSKKMLNWDYVKRINSLVSLEDNSDGESYSPWMQYTGLKDKNSKEIYEGDIVKGCNGHIGKVVFEDAMFNVDGYYDGGADYPTIAFSEGVFEVIGNIYENPELIK